MQEWGNVQIYGQLHDKFMNQNSLFVWDSSMKCFRDYIYHPDLSLQAHKG